MILGIYGAGGSGKEMLEMINKYDSLKSRWDGIVFIDDTQEEGVFKSKQRIPFNAFQTLYKPTDVEIIIAVGEPKYRDLLADKIIKNGYSLTTIISPNASISSDCIIENGVIIKDYSFVSNDAFVGFNTLVQSNAIIGHDAKVGRNCTISAFSAIAGRTIVSDNVFVGISASIREDLHIGEFSIISMGAVVLKDVRSYKIVIGNPAREIAENKDCKVFK